MSAYSATGHTFRDLRDLLAKASPLRSGDQLAGLAVAVLLRAGHFFASSAGNVISFSSRSFNNVSRK